MVIKNIEEFDLENPTDRGPVNMNQWFGVEIMDLRKALLGDDKQDLLMHIQYRKETDSYVFDVYRKKNKKEEK